MRLRFGPSRKTSNGKGVTMTRNVEVVMPTVIESTITRGEPPCSLVSVLSTCMRYGHLVIGHGTIPCYTRIYE